jgi:hypothetical protein
MAGMSHDSPPGGYKVVLVPAENIRAHSPPGVLPAYVTVSQDVLYEVAGEVREVRATTRMGRTVRYWDPPLSEVMAGLAPSDLAQNPADVR